jgi:hypothetical protein
MSAEEMPAAASNNKAIVADFMMSPWKNLGCDTAMRT